MRTESDRATVIAMPVFALDNVPDAARSGVLRQALHDYSIPLDLHLDSSHNLRARFEAVALGGGMIESFEIEGANGFVQRPATTRDSGTRPQLTVHLLSAGSVTLHQNDRSAKPKPGDMVLSSNEFPFVTEQRGICHQRTFTFGYDELGVTRRMVRDLVGRSISGVDDVTTVVTSFLSRLAASASRSPALDWSPMTQPTLGMVRALLTTAHTDDRSARESLAMSLEDRILEYVRVHISDPGLSASRIAYVHGISVRYLYLLLARRNISLGDHIRTETGSCCLIACALRPQAPFRFGGRSLRRILGSRALRSNLPLGTRNDTERVEKEQLSVPLGV